MTTKRLFGSHRGFSLVEMAIVAVLLSVMVISYFTLSRQETISVQNVRDRAQAMALARNLLCLVRYGHNRVWLDNAGAPSEPGVFDFPIETIPQAELALGPALTAWTTGKQVETTLRWEPEAKDSGGNVVDGVGKLTCIVVWTADGGVEKRVELPGIMER